MKNYLCVFPAFFLCIMLQAQSATKSEAEPFFKVVDQLPMFPGCDSLEDLTERKKCSDRLMLEYIYKNLKYPLQARKKKIQGTVFVTFVIEPDGTLSNEAIMRDIGGGCGDATLEVIDKMRKDQIRWHPGIQKGEPVRVQYNLPVRFKLK
ncbi:MAG: energy transducer TonB [Saprospiraceae bacterium]|nr:energy transducer TonB [Saprospiraceae bacterium]